MIFGILRLLIWLAGFLVVAYIGMSFFGYTVDWDVLKQNQTSCANAYRTCQETFLKKGLEGAKTHCEYTCFSLDKIIKNK